MNHDIQESLAYARHLLAEHRRVQALVDRIEEQWSLNDDQGQPATSIAELRGAVEQLRDELVRHFREEEAGGVLEEAAARRPDLGREAVRLEEEHADLLRQVEQIIAALTNAADFKSLPEAVKRDFSQLVKRLTDHEAGENRLLQKGFDVEVT